jgi:hypothetical protein
MFAITSGTPAQNNGMSVCLLLAAFGVPALFWLKNWLFGPLHTSNDENDQYKS